VWESSICYPKNGGLAGTRTPTNGFGDRSTAIILPTQIWSGKGGSNSRPIPWQGIALPAELFPHKTGTP